MNPEELEDLAALYALDLLDGSERLAFEQVLETNPSLKQLVADLKETQAVWVESLPQTSPPAHIKEPVFAALSAEDEKVNETKIVAMPRSWTRVWAIAAALILVLIGVFGLQHRSEEKTAPFAITPTPVLPKIPLAPTPDAPKPGDVAVIWHADHQQVELIASALPKAPEGQDYQLWVLDADNPKPVSVGIFTPNAEGEASLLMAPVGQVGTKLNFAVSLEPAGGSAQPTGKIVYVGKPG